MKTKFLLLSLTLLASYAIVQAQTPKKILVAYFSHSGNTRIIAGNIKTATDADIFEIVPFITHEGSRMGHSVMDIKKLCPKSTVLAGLPIQGGSVRNAHDEVIKWLREIKMIK